MIIVREVYVEEREGKQEAEVKSGRFGVAPARALGNFRGTANQRSGTGRVILGFLGCRQSSFSSRLPTFLNICLCCCSAPYFKASINTDNSSWRDHMKEAKVDILPGKNRWISSITTGSSNRSVSDSGTMPFRKEGINDSPEKI